jgi:hypothetical protein
MSALPPKQTWTPSYLVLISGTASYKRLRYYSGSLSYQFGKAATKLDIKNLFDAIGGHAFIMHQFIKLLFQ